MTTPAQGPFIEAMNQRSEPVPRLAAKLLEEVGDDSVSGASAIYRRVLSALAAELDFPSDLPKRLRALAGDMAPLRFLASRLEAETESWARMARELLAEMEYRRSRLARELEPLVAHQRLLCHSNSGTVTAALTGLSHPSTAVVQTLSLPGGEGRPAARELRGAGMEVALVDDEAALELLRRHHLLPVMGVDAVTETYLVNKVGTMAIVRAAEECGIRPLFLSGPEKRLTEAQYGRRPKSPLFQRVPLRGVRVMG